MNIGAKAMESYQCPQPTNCNRLSPLTPPRDASSPPWERQPRRSGTSQSLESSVFVIVLIMERPRGIWHHGSIRRRHVATMVPSNSITWRLLRRVDSESMIPRRSFLNLPFAARPRSLSNFDAMNQRVSVFDNESRFCLCFCLCFCFVFLFSIIHSSCHLCVIWM